MTNFEHYYVIKIGFSINQKVGVTKSFSAFQKFKWPLFWTLIPVVARKGLQCSSGGSTALFQLPAILVSSLLSPSRHSRAALPVANSPLGNSAVFSLFLYPATLLGISLTVLLTICSSQKFWRKHLLPLVEL